MQLAIAVDVNLAIVNKVELFKVSLLSHRKTTAQSFFSHCNYLVVLTETIEKLRV